jgi:hypothetical protein
VGRKGGSLYISGEKIEILKKTSRHDHPSTIVPTYGAGERSKTRKNNSPQKGAKYAKK